MADAVMSKEEFNRLLREEPLPAPYNSAMGRSAAWVDTWPPIWKSLEEVSHYVSLQPFLELEESIKDDPRQKKLLRILKRVRKTRGYGLNCHHEKIMGYPLSWRPLRPHLCGMVRRRLGLVIAKMNALAQSHGYVGYVYEFSELENVVSHPIRKCILLSFSVKEFYCGQFVEFKDVRANVFFWRRRAQLCFGRLELEAHLMEKRSLLLLLLLTLLLLVALLCILLGFISGNT